MSKHKADLGEGH
jgi:hypothetical protein